MNKRKKWILIAVLSVVLAVVAAFFAWRMKNGNSKSVYLVETVARGDMENSVTATGTIEPLEQVDVGTQVSGIIANIYVDYNSQVRKGEVIAELDKTVLQTELASAELNVESCRNEYEYQQKNFARTKTLYSKKLVSDSEYETAEYDYNKSRISYEQAKAQEEKARTNLGYATIYSPIDGVVISKAVEEGQTVASSYSTPTLFTIANDLTRIQVVADVDEADIGQVSEGSDVTFTVDAYPMEIFSGKVSQVRMEAITTNNVVTYEVVIHAENPDMKLKPGLTANINIYSMRRLGVLRVPVKATRFRPALGENAGIADREDEKSLSVSSTGRESKEVPSAVKGGKSGTDKVSVKDFLTGRGPLTVSSGDSVREATVYVLPSSLVVDPELASPQARRVKLGVTDRIYYEVLEGLSEGETVCVGFGSVEEAKEVSSERSPFMPGPPGGNRKESKKK